MGESQMNKYPSRSIYKRNTRQNICVDNETYSDVLQVKGYLETINSIFPFTSKVISQHDTIKYLCKFFKNEYLDKTTKEITDILKEKK
tara:strand:- start:90 stop:353 length:264 start_codon:yes stop_codon:yes gene_type:complete